MAKAPVSYSGFVSLPLGHRFDSQTRWFSVLSHRWSMYVRTKRDVKCAQYVYHWYVQCCEQWNVWDVREIQGCGANYHGGGRNVRV